MLEITMIGHIGQDAVVKKVNDKEFISFSVAHTDKFTAQDGTVTEKTTWVNFTKTLSNESKLLPYLKKGTLVYVRGTIASNAYTDKNGQVCSSLNSVIKHIELLGSTNKETNTESTSEQPPF